MFNPRSEGNNSLYQTTYAVLETEADRLTLGTQCQRDIQRRSIVRLASHGAVASFVPHRMSAARTTHSTHLRATAEGQKRTRLLVIRQSAIAQKKKEKKKQSPAWLPAAPLRLASFLDAGMRGADCRGRLLRPRPPLHPSAPCPPPRESFQALPSSTTTASTAAAAPSSSPPPTSEESQELNKNGRKGDRCCQARTGMGRRRLAWQHHHSFLKRATITVLEFGDI